ncbi:FAD/NAD(P)-binding protein [Frankia sp. AiPs1]|uniref:FAD/NAD(P)-binding protein n=1 Tax=Frankia sp. AiPs1 TaxID=573493 RepID=UPI002043169F|nr:FAD/NAD(P)-binding protein [Frankia sp. AiPs1]MCM3920739.1 FAD/NAD(P)-binding protein [Frankia sp. AiPs1]
MSARPKIGVIGGGASAVCLLDALAQRQDLPPGHLTIFDGGRHLWRGRPYQPDLDAMRVNAIPRDMSVRAGDDGHLADWLAARRLVVGTGTSFLDPVSGAPFIPRAMFGDYLEQAARVALVTLAARGWRVDLHRRMVHRAVPTRHGLALRTADGEEHEVDYAVLATGAGTPADPYGLAGSAGFVRDPYPVAERLAAIRRDDDLAVIGSGLTAVDVALALAARGHTGRIRLHSRQAVLPAVRQRPACFIPRHVTAARFRAMAAWDGSLPLADLIAMIGDELAAAGESLDTVRTEIDAARREDPTHRLLRQLDAVNAPDGPLRILQQIMPDVGPDVWPLLPEHDKDRLLATHHRAFMSLCCPMPPASAVALLGLLESGQLELIGGLERIERAERAEPGGCGFVASSVHGEHRADVIVNAVNGRLGGATDLTAPMLASLVDAGLAEPHPHGGFHLERATSRLTVGARPNRRLYALGDLAMGSLFFTFGIQSLVDRAVDIVTSIRGDIAHRALQTPRRAGRDVLQPI